MFGTEVQWPSILKQPTLGKTASSLSGHHQRSPAWQPKHPPLGEQQTSDKHLNIKLKAKRLGSILVMDNITDHEAVNDILYR